ncbi:MAG TPA: hypothetical protein VJN18_30200 [Polyangiaceae bacterium]|nr:hypothetical protein [Polyangiaceae bacterium]
MNYDVGWDANNVSAAEAAHNAELANEVSSVGFDVPALDELRSRHQLERRARRTWLRRPSASLPPPAPPRRRPTPGRRRVRVRRRCHRRRAREQSTRGARGDPDGDPDPDGRHVSAEAHARIGDKDPGKLSGLGQQHAALPNVEGEACR